MPSVTGARNPSLILVDFTYQRRKDIRVKSIGITLGDQAGIGPEVVRAALTSGQLPPGFDFKIIGKEIDVVPGKSSRQSAKAALDALEKSVRLLKSGDIAAVVTAPVGKEGLHELGFHFPGQTEFFADRLGCKNHAMCLTGENLTVALVTIHVAVAQVPDLLRTSEVVRIGKLLAGFCKQRGIEKPRIAVCGLNPHAGESGAFGNEDIEIVAPAVNQLRSEGQADFSGPHPPDTIFRPAADGEYDAVLCMYHDQGLIPLKLLDFDTGVNVTLGLPYPRTSPDHGTAYDIAGTGKANPSSMIHAIQLACKMVSQIPE
ncbi:MAG: 4-hydroxythreonine-4-phosphate dehydrogenase PdxA [Akkermansiaceae bacterium]